MQELFEKINKINLENALYIVATPIGNIKDITFRAIEILKSCNYIFCEDTRICGNLLNIYNIEHGRLNIYNDHSDKKQREKIVNLIKEGNSVALISDAGTPTISDPGYKLLLYCRENNIKIIPIPGCSACIAAISASGISTDKFLFYGFLSNNKNKKVKEINEIMKKDETVILYESPERLLNTLEIIKNTDNNRTICVAKELTKLFENIITKNADDIFLYYKNNQDKIKGEFVIIIEKTNTNDKLDLKNMDNIMKNSLKYMSVKDSSEFLSDILKLKKNEIYKRLLIFKEK